MGKKHRAPRLIVVKQAEHLTKNMIRVTFAGDALKEFPVGREGGNCKIMLPADGQSLDEFSVQLERGPKPVTRTYTVRAFRQDSLELDIDFVAHGDNGPAARWAMSAAPGSFCGFAGPSMPKLSTFHADTYLLAADMSALPVASVTLETMPRDAKGVAVFEILSEEDRQEINAPPGIDIHWIVSPDPHRPSRLQEEFIRNMTWPAGSLQTCIAGESGVIRSLRGFLHNEKAVPRENTYISGYWKIGLVEDEHQAEKRAESQ
ncbi:MAG: siderophore-interacting protein [Alphaproteobacteria bacterium]|nr:siderophore-interacting protein [Alphaproteobacteria bacterium]